MKVEVQKYGKVSISKQKKIKLCKSIQNMKTVQKYALVCKSMHKQKVRQMCTKSARKIT